MLRDRLPARKNRVRTRSQPLLPEQGASDSGNKSETAAPMATIKPEALREFSEQPAEVQQLIRNSLALTEQNLSYKYGSADPAAGGMDCSGFIYFVLSSAGFKDVPSDSAGQYELGSHEQRFSRGAEPKRMIPSS